MGSAKMRQTLYDSLTGLPKLDFLKSSITDFILQSSDNQFAGVDRYALVYLDIDNFKYINETFGFKASNEVIK